MGTMKKTMTQKLNDAFAPTSLKVSDESYQHLGHSGWREGGQTHFRVEMTSAAFTGKSRLDRHRMINEVLGEELAGAIHALALEVIAPGETPRKKAKQES